MDVSVVRLCRLASRAALALLAALALGTAGCDCGSNVDDPKSGSDAEAGTDAGAASDSGGSDAASDGGPPTGPYCGNGIVEDMEACDDGNKSDDDECLSDCSLACGDGMLSPIEECDIGIPAGMPGGCPIVCDDGDACTIDAIEGSGCGAVCESTPSVTKSGGTIIGMFVDGDGCCASIADANVDSDCLAMCGNGILEPGETCEPASGCATSCDDGNACTVDTLLGSSSTCDAACTIAALAGCVDGDGCCAPGCCGPGTPGCTTPDTDCSTSCGDGVVDPLETCDPPSSCPLACDDGDACTIDTITGDPAQCNVACSATPLTTLMDGDGCCPAGADANGDTDCASMCGNGILEPGEDCDDGNSTPDDGCDASCLIETAAFRLIDLDVRDPHIYVDIPFGIGCTDVTDMIPGMLARSINESIQDSIQMDEDFDGFLDLSILLLFRPLDQSTPIGPTEYVSGLCPPPPSGTTCSLDPTIAPQATIYTNLSGVCIDAFPGTLTPLAGGYSPPLLPATGPCFVTGIISLSLPLQGTTIPLLNGQVGAKYIGSPATAMTDGIVRGFLTEADADLIPLPSYIPFVGGMPISYVLPGGTGACATHDDRDIGPDGLTLGWWVYANFATERVSWSGP